MILCIMRLCFTHRLGDLAHILLACLGFLPKKIRHGMLPGLMLPQRQPAARTRAWGAAPASNCWDSHETLCWYGEVEMWRISGLTANTPTSLQGEPLPQHLDFHRKEIPAQELTGEPYVLCPSPLSWWWPVAPQFSGTLGQELETFLREEGQERSEVKNKKHLKRRKVWNNIKPSCENSWELVFNCFFQVSLLLNRH